jgi:hypothetical protein
MKTLKLVSLGLVAFAVFGVMAFAQQGQKQETKTDYTKRHAIMQECAKACLDCQRACDLCTGHDADMPREAKKDYVTAPATCRDCATICSAAAAIVARGGPFTGLICEACAKACGQCATVCKTSPDDQNMKSCAEECLKCERACRTMIQPPATM